MTRQSCSRTPRRVIAALVPGAIIAFAATATVGHAQAAMITLEHAPDDGGAPTDSLLRFPPQVVINARTQSAVFHVVNRSVWPLTVSSVVTIARRRTPDQTRRAATDMAYADSLRRDSVADDSLARQYSLRAWITKPVMALTIAVNDSQTVRVQVAIPPHPRPGEYFAYIYFHVHSDSGSHFVEIPASPDASVRVLDSTGRPVPAVTSYQARTAPVPEGTLIARLGSEVPGQDADSESPVKLVYRVAEGR